MATSSPSLSLRSIVGNALRDAGFRPDLRAYAGLTPAAKALIVAGLAQQTPGVYVVPGDRDVDPAVTDIRFFLASLAGWSDADAERLVLPCPSHEVDPYRGLTVHFDIASARARALVGLASGTVRVVVTSAAGLLPRVSSADRLARAGLSLAPGTEIGPDQLAAALVAAGFIREDPVDQHGEFSIRGGVADIFPAGETHPIRIEFIGDTIESIRRFDPETQRSISALDRVEILPLREILPAAGAGDGPPDRSATLLGLAHAGLNASLVVSEPDLVIQQGRARVEQIHLSYGEARGRGEIVDPPEELIASWDHSERLLLAAVRLYELDLGDAGVEGAEARHIPCQTTTPFRGRMSEWAAEIQRARERHDTVVCVVGTPGKAERTLELLKDYEIRAVALEGAETTARAGALIALGTLSRGFRLPEARLQLYAETDIFDEDRTAHERRRAVTRAFLSDFRDLKAGDHVVHVDHGIGMFVGLRKLAVGIELHEFMELRYADDNKLFVPMDRLDLVQKYSGGTRPTLDRLGGTTWEKAKTRVRKAMRDMAGDLLKLYAARKAVPGHAFGPDTHWQQEFEAAFEYELTPDQAAAVADIKRDMEAPTPMDRLLCGDVGYGKTEVAMRAAFKAVMDGKQVALLAPTTVLALQHLKTFRNRFAAFPVRIDMVSRFRSKAEQTAIVADLTAGRLDIIIGTHRLLSKDVQFHDLGLLIVDEEQRFGVAHKERIKQLRRRVDALALSATPIPRTLNMSLIGIRDMSVIETPPRDRLSIQTSVIKFDQRVVTSALRHELERSGQVYFVHNRVESIYSMANLLRRLVPEARVGIGHGQMAERELERVMVDFVEGRHDVLLATTIIENGLDIPNANTIVINRADRYGLAQLYQLRGRVGRSDRRAYAYLLTPPREALSPIARKRLAAIHEFSDLGSGFRIAALDLEIRGAGNLLGGEQSGHIEAVGFEMYMKLLEETIRELKGEDLQDVVRAAVNLGVDLKIEEQYVPDMNQRLGVYRKFAAVRTDGELDKVVDEVRDRYGPLPASLLRLTAHARIRLLADRLRLEGIDRERHQVVVKFRQDSRVDPARFVNLVKRRPDLQLRTPVTLVVDLKVAPAEERFQSRGEPAVRRSRPAAGSSWWTRRATAGAVTPGFTKEQILTERPDDPLAAGGLFDRIGELLSALAAS